MLIKTYIAEKDDREKIEFSIDQMAVKPLVALIKSIILDLLGSTGMTKLMIKTYINKFAKQLEDRLQDGITVNVKTRHGVIPIKFETYIVNTTNDYEVVGGDEESVNNEKKEGKEQ